jgi:tRNA-2-methylthio-N6-dimethylallyladenosine synthase
VPAARFETKIAEEVKKERLQQVLDCQKEITQRIHQDLVGTVQRVLVDGVSKTIHETDNQDHGDQGDHGVQWSGRTPSNKIVHFNPCNSKDQGNQVLTGWLMDIMIEEALPHCLLGQPV